MSSKVFKVGRFEFNLESPKIMGILNLTPDSFSDAGKYFTADGNIDKAMSHVEQMIADGVDIIDIGAESTRPNADYIPSDIEISRLKPVICEIQKTFNICLSVDTSKLEVMQAVIDLGVDMINDVNGFQEIGTLELLSKTNLGLCIMHRRGTPKTMQNFTDYHDFISEIKNFLYKQANIAIELGISSDSICIDPGFGFAKNKEQNIELIKHVKQFNEQYPVLFGLSKKGTIGQILEDSTADRNVASVVGSLLAIQNGAAIVRVHDVKSMHDAIKVYEAVGISF